MTKESVVLWGINVPVALKDHCMLVRSVERDAHGRTLRAHHPILVPFY